MQLSSGMGTWAAALWWHFASECTFSAPCRDVAERDDSDDSRVADDDEVPDPLAPHRRLGVLAFSL